MKSFWERLKSPVVWSAALTVIYAQAQLLMDYELTAKRLILSAVIVTCSIFSALNDPTNRDGV